MLHNTRLLWKPLWHSISMTIMSSTACVIPQRICTGAASSHFVHTTLVESGGILSLHVHLLPTSSDHRKITWLETFGLWIVHAYKDLICRFGRWVSKALCCRMRDTAVVRASDDFYPGNEASSNPHVAACAFNSLFIGAIAQPDWDMFHSRHPAAILHASARALSGGAVYVSDYPGKHNFDVLRRLVLPDGTILRAKLPGRPTRDSIFNDVLRDNKSLMKVERS